ncbi:MAG TPA: hypothetical protein VFE24_00060 [Pirellulales bacterium]|nr:hypothetical protein [Pirellulales bacterium]
MHAAILTLLLMAGTSSDPSGARTAQYANAPEPAGQCANCEDSAGGHGAHCQDSCGVLAGWRDMPQSCYNPAYGCYPGNDRRINRYPAFYGTYYRKPYNYRNVFDYPWHAGLHEPTSLFSYNVSNPDDSDRAPPPSIRPAASETHASENRR